MRGDFAAVVILALAVLGFWATREGTKVEYQPTLGLDLSSLRVIDQGEVVGFSPLRGAHAWLGIPYASPPTDALRWRAPRPPERWTKVRAALAHGPACAQFARPVGVTSAASGTGEVTGNEDCLSLNVYAPHFGAEAVPQGAARLPVMVWIHGGNNTIGSAATHDGGTLALSRDVVVVTLQYRLGALGWFSHPALHESGSSTDDRSGNFGTLDIIAALDWVQANIANFGGDPDRVTIFGESSGATNIYSLLLSPRAEGLFHRAILQSGSLHTTPLDTARNLVDDPKPGHRRSSSEVVAQLLVLAGNASNEEDARKRVRALSDAQTREVLRSATTAQLLEAYRGETQGRIYDHPQLFRDGHVLPKADPLRVLAAGNYHQVPILIGGNRDEHNLFLLYSSASVWQLLGLPFGSGDEARYLRDAEYLSLMWKARGVDEPATTMRAAQGASVYGYRFDWDEQPDLAWLDIGTIVGAARAMEVPFVFGRLSLGDFTQYIFSDERRPQAEALSAAMTSYWTQFAATGDPGQGRQGELPEWPDWGDGRYLVLDTAQDGGIRVSRATVSSQSVLARMEGDPRFESQNERCETYRTLASWPGWLSPAEFDRIGGACSGVGSEG
ncbi:MAG: carboxylesterase family protein [Myxococcota bacterium]